MAHFVKHTSCPNCGSSDNLAIYSDNSYYCFSQCGYKSLSQDYKEELDSKQSKSKVRVKSTTGTQMEQQTNEVKSTKPAITDEENQAIKDQTSVTGNGFRGIRDDIYKMFGVRHGFDESTGEVVEQYYPVTQDGQLAGYKIRDCKVKNFRSKGRTGADCELFMAFKFNRGGKYIVITEGEVCALSAYQILKDYNTKRGSDYEIAVVSATTGANSQKQLAANYKFLDQFDNIILALDNDKAGKDATDKIIPVLPKGKVKIMQLRYKDHNDYLEKGKDKEYIQDFYAAKVRVPVGVLPSSSLYERMMQQVATPKVPFPAFMGKLNDMFIGGMPLGYIFNIAADTGVGKTTFVNEMVYYWIFNSPHLIGIVSMELDAGQYTEVLLSRHISRKLSLMGDTGEKLKYLSSDKVKEQVDQLTLKEDGSERFYLLDNRDGTVEEIQDTIEELVVSCGCKVIICDPLQDILEGLSNDEQALFMKWAKGFIKSHNVSFVLINHMRKSDNSGEQDIMGHSSIIKSASANIILKRDKLAEDDMVRNTTTISVAKNRVCGLTGPAGGMYYDNSTHTLHELDKWMDDNGIIPV